ncbi:hypothetical protein ACI6Q2_13545 [Chitinophagaceae bacterium LWZ2-11]
MKGGYKNIYVLGRLYNNHQFDENEISVLLGTYKWKLLCRITDNIQYDYVFKNPDEIFLLEMGIKYRNTENFFIINEDNLLLEEYTTMDYIHTLDDLLFALQTDKHYNIPEKIRMQSFIKTEIRKRKLNELLNY